MNMYHMNSAKVLKTDMNMIKQEDFKRNAQVLKDQRMKNSIIL